MPPKPKCTREQIVEAAFIIVKEEGSDALTARSLAKSLDVTVSPIFTVFSGMEEIKAAVQERAKDFLFHYLRGCEDFNPAFKEFGLRWVNFSIENRNIYQLIFSGNSEYSVLLSEFSAVMNPILADLENSMGFTAAEALELLNQMLIHANGIAAFSFAGHPFTEEQISKSISETCIGLILLIKAKNNTLNPEIAHIMASTPPVKPVRKA